MNKKEEKPLAQGIALGITTDNVGLRIGVGLAIGAGIDIAMSQRKKDE